jgi:hypothetical protein
MGDLCSAVDAAPERPAVEGVVSGPADLVVFIGLFPYPYPQGLPSACTARTGPGPYALQAPTPARGHVAAVAFDPNDSVVGCVLPEPGSVMVASRTAPVKTPIGGLRRDLRLRPQRNTDPPLLLALPLVAPGRVAPGAAAARA